MKNSITRLGAIAAANLGLLFVLSGPGHLSNVKSSQATTPATKTEIQAEILPAATFAVGPSLSAGPDGKAYGIGLTANDISNSWTTCTTTCTLDFVFFVFSNKDEAAHVQFKVISPANTTVYTYTWTSKLVATNWYVAYAKGDYKAAGTYFAEVYVSSQLDGWLPVVFAK